MLSRTRGQVFTFGAPDLAMVNTMAFLICLGGRRAGFDPSALKRYPQCPPLLHRIARSERKKIRRETFLRSQYPVVEEWQPIEDDGLFCLSGKIFNDTRFVDGSPIVTSGLVWIDHLLAKTARSKYVLGTPSVDYIRFREQHTLGPISTKRFHYACY